MHKPQLISLSLFAVLLAACGSHTSVQRGYNTDRDTCQAFSEAKLPLFMDESQPISLKQRNAKLVTLFSDCMFEKGWTVATPTRAGGDDFKADPGVGVGASIRPGRFSSDLEADHSTPSDDSTAYQGSVEESPDLLINQGGAGTVRKIPLENIGQR